MSAEEPLRCAAHPDGIQGVVAKMDTIIASNGHAVLAIDHGGSVVAYTVGLAEAGWPEFVMTGLPYEVSLDLLNDAVRLMRGRERPAAAGEVMEKVASFPLRVRRLEGHPATALKGAAARLRTAGLDPSGLQALQITWPDTDGHHPDDTEYDPRYAQQILL